VNDIEAASEAEAIAVLRALNEGSKAHQSLRIKVTTDPFVFHSNAQRTVWWGIVGVEWIGEKKDLKLGQPIPVQLPDGTAKLTVGCLQYEQSLSMELVNEDLVRTMVYATQRRWHVLSDAEFDAREALEKRMRIVINGNDKFKELRLPENDEFYNRHLVEIQWRKGRVIQVVARRQHSELVQHVLLEIIEQAKGVVNEMWRLATNDEASGKVEMPNGRSAEDLAAAEERKTTLGAFLIMGESTSEEKTENIIYGGLVKSLIADDAQGGSSLTKEAAVQLARSKVTEIERWRDANANGGRKVLVYFGTKEDRDWFCANALFTIPPNGNRKTTVVLWPCEPNLNKGVGVAWGQGQRGVGRGAGSRPGDWVCGRCQGECFGSKSACYKCNAPKPAGPAQPSAMDTGAPSAPPAPAWGATNFPSMGSGALELRMISMEKKVVAQDQKLVQVNACLNSLPVAIKEIATQVAEGLQKMNTGIDAKVEGKVDEAMQQLLSVPGLTDEQLAMMRQIAQAGIAGVKTTQEERHTLTQELFAAGAAQTARLQVSTGQAAIQGSAAAADGS
jgi:hypothetical protein